MDPSILLTKYIAKDKNASQKAPEDIEKIFLQNFGSTYRVRNIENLFLSYFDTLFQILKIRTYKQAYKYNLVVQWPLYVRRPFKSSWFLSDRFRRKIAIIHDIDSLRFSPNDISKIHLEIDELNRFDCVIAHNKSMELWLYENGLNTKVITLNIFDYLSDYKLNLNHFGEYEIVVAGNLNKSSFLKEIDMVVKHRINAYGPLTDYAIPPNMNYMGSFSPNELPLKIKGDFGLIWDGDSTQTCSGNNGNYMRYNNPHKLSLYISCGLPVIVWEEAAIACFVKDHEIGIVIKSLSDLDSELDKVTSKQYENMVKNVNKLAEKIVKGKNTIEVISLAINAEK